MSKSLYARYESELHFIRKLAQEFAEQHPAEAGRLLLEPNRSLDPHVERLIEAFALLTARVQNKLDDEFPELTDALLNVLYPHYLAPVPSMAIVQFELDAARVSLPDGFLIEKGSVLQTPPIRDLRCKFRTGYPVTLWPVELTAARLMPPPFPAGLRAPPKTAAALRLQFECQSDLRFADMSLDRLRLFLAGDGQLTGTLYELLFNHATQVLFRPLDLGPDTPPLIVSPADCLHQVGFERDESLLPYPSNSFLGYRLLTEFFAFPSKFLFVDLGGWRAAQRRGFGLKTEVVIFLNRSQASLEQAVDTQTFRLGCTPAINLFPQTAEPIPLTHARSEYQIVPDVSQPQGMEVYSVDSVTSAEPGSTTEYQPFYSFRHGSGRQDRRTFWYASRRPSLRENDRGTDVFLSLVDLDFDPHLPAEAVLIPRTTCTNRDLPASLRQVGEAVTFDLEREAPLTRIRCLRSPSVPLRPPPRRGAHWRLISHLCLNHLSISDPVEGREALQEILRLYDFSDPEAGQQFGAVNRQMIDGITAVSSRRVVGRVPGAVAGGFCRGIEVTLELDDQKYLGTGSFLFACVVERFLGLYASINSFSQLVARTQQGEGYFKKWQPRAGEQQLL